MPALTLVSAKADIVSELRAASVVTADSLDVFDYMPPISALEQGRGIAVFTAGITADFWQIGMRIMVSALASPKDAQDQLDEWMPALSDALSSPYGPEEWEITFPSEEAPYYAATCILQVGREDYY